MNKNPIRNEHYEAYRAGRYSEIPEAILALLDAQIGRPEKKTESKKKAEDSK